jgi:hypothetical protein
VDFTGITAAEQSPSDTYARLLLPKKYGYPLWLQDPDVGLPLEYRSVGVNIGDVGTVTYDGGFDFFFNIRCEASDPVNQFGVPDGFMPLVLKDEYVLGHPQRHVKGTHIFGGHGPFHKERLVAEYGNME